MSDVAIPSADLAPLTRAEQVAFDDCEQRIERGPRRKLKVLTAEEQAQLERCEAIIATRYGPPAPGSLSRRSGVTKRDQRPHDVYVHLDADDVVLYVGISLTLAERSGYHRANSGWWGQVATIRVEHLPNRAAALAREAELIAELKPMHNRAGVA